MINAAIGKHQIDPITDMSQKTESTIAQSIAKSRSHIMGRN